MHKKIIEERNRSTQHEKCTKYADKSYKYEPMKPVHIENPLQLSYWKIIK